MHISLSVAWFPDAKNNQLSPIQDGGHALQLTRVNSAKREIDPRHLASISNLRLDTPV